MSTMKVSTPPKKPSNPLVPPNKLSEKVAAAKPSSLGNLKKTQAVQHFKCPKCDFTDKSKNNVKQHIISEHKIEPYDCPFCHVGFTNFAHLNKHIKQSHSGKAPLKEPYEAVEFSANTTKEMPKLSGKSEKPKSDKNLLKKSESEEREDSKTSSKVPGNKKSVENQSEVDKSSKDDLSSRRNETQDTSIKISTAHPHEVLIPGPSKTDVAVPKVPTKNEIKVLTQIKPEVFVPVPPKTKVAVSNPPAKNELENLAPKKPGSLSPLLDIHTGSSLTPILQDKAWIRMKEDHLRNELLKNPRSALLQGLYPMKAFSAQHFANHPQPTEKMVVESAAVPAVDHFYRQQLIESDRGRHLLELYPMKSFDASNFDEISFHQSEASKENYQDDVLSTVSNYMKNVRNVSVEYLKSFGVNLGVKK